MIYLHYFILSSSYLFQKSSLLIIAKITSESVANLGQGSVKEKKRKWNGAILLSTKFSICDSKFIGGAEGSMMHNMES